jgi:hypothetical protein
MEETLSLEELSRLPNLEIATYLSKVQRGIQSLFMGAPVLADVDRIVVSVDWADGALVIAAQPDVPRNVTATLTDADNSVSGVLTIVGKDIRGRTITEVQTVVLGVGKAFVGTKIFASITSITITGTSGATPSTDVVTVGVGDVIGTPMDLDSVATVHHVYLGGTRIASPVLTTGVSLSGINASAGTYNGAKILHAFLDLSRAT